MNPILLTATLGDSIDKIFYNFDMWVYHIFGAIQCDFLTEFAKFITSFGDVEFVIGIIVLGIILCLFKRTRKFGFALVFSVAIGTILTNIVLKPLVLRVRPYNTLQNVAEYWNWYVGAGMLAESDYSFPSGHTTVAFELATSMFLCFKANKKKIAWLFPVLAVGIMGSRVYLMVHYPTDVIVGMLAGIIAGILGYLIANAIIKAFKKSNKDDKLDLENLYRKKFKKNINNKVACVLIVLFCACSLVFSYITLVNEIKAEPVRCEYCEEYDCQNIAKLDDEKYPAIDGKRYCKIHWNELSGNAE